MHKCDGCAHKGEHREMGFMAEGVCLCESNLLDAVLAFRSPVCPHGGNTQSSYRQVSKSLCGKENATLDELLTALNQLKDLLANAEREKAAAIYDMVHVAPEELCEACAFSKLASKCEEADFNCEQCQDAGCPCRECRDCRSRFSWRGVCPENTKEDPDAN